MADVEEETTEESLFEAPPLAEQERMVEAILFASAEPVGIPELNARMPTGAMQRLRWNCCRSDMTVAGSRL